MTRSRDRTRRLSRAPAESAFAWPLLSGIIGALLGVMLMTFRATATPPSKAFSESVGFRVWVFLIAGLVAYAGAVSPLLLRSFLSLRRKYGIEWKHLGVEPVLLALGLVVIALLGEESPTRSALSHMETRVLLLTFGLFAVTLSGVLGMQVVRRAAHKGLEGLHGTLPEALDYLEPLQSALQGFLVMFGGMVTLVVIATGGLVKAVSAFQDPDAPVEVVLIYGASFAALTAALYLPGYLAIRRLATSVLDRLCPWPSDASFASTYDVRKKLADVLGLEANPRENLENGILILSPLISGFITLFIPGQG